MALSQERQHALETGGQGMELNLTDGSQKK